MDRKRIIEEKVKYVKDILSFVIIKLIFRVCYG